MKLLAVSDIHGNHTVYKWLVDQANTTNVDALVLAGDLLGSLNGYDTIEEAQRQDASAIVAILQATAVPIYYIMGNNDLIELDPGSDQFIAIHGRRVALAHFNLIGYRYTLPFMGGIYEKPENEIAADLDRLQAEVDTNTILVTHNPAYGVLDIGILKRRAGSHAILNLVQNHSIRIHIHGHTHQCFGRMGCHFNVASAGKCRAMLIDPETLVAATVEAEEMP